MNNTRKIFRHQLCELEHEGRHRLATETRNHLPSATSLGNTFATQDIKEGSAVNRDRWERELSMGGGKQGRDYLTPLSPRSARQISFPSSAGV